MATARPHVLLYCHHTLSSETRSGIQRVVVEAARAMAPLATVELVKWDDLEGQLRHLTEDEIRQIFGKIRPPKIQANRYCARVNYRFVDTIGKPEQTWLLFPEIGYHQENGNEKFARILTQCKYYGIRTACIFYDLIPVRDADYATHKKPHVEYLLETLRCDRIFTISRYVADDLREFFGSILPPEHAKDLSEAIVPVPLGENNASQNLPEAPSSTSKRIVLLGTIEPRKQQTRFLRIFNQLAEKEALLREFTIDLFGSLHHLSSDELNAEMARNPKIAYHRYAGDAAIWSSLADSAFSVFISRNEGFGLPIVESLGLGVPCMTSNFGSMAEIAERGGCFLVDSMSDDSIAEGILQLVHQRELLDRLRAEARSRKAVTWSDYAASLLEGMPAQEEIPDPDLETFLNAVVAEHAPNPCKIGGAAWIVSRSSASSRPALQPGHRALCVIDWTPEQLSAATDEALMDVCRADILTYLNETTYEAFPHRLRERNIQALPPRHAGILPAADEIASSWLSRAVKSLSLHAVNLVKMARRENLYGEAAQALSSDLPEQQHDLTIIISTYNRAAFTELNVSWLLDKIDKYRSRVQLVVVDNASTDDTVERLRAFSSNSSFKLVVNPNNTGMLGNLHICSKQLVARHVWLIGDDDFIHEEAIDELLKVLKEKPRLPLINTNFAVYHRTAVGEGDLPEQFIREGHVLCPNAPESGEMEIIRVAELHDNLYTAIYPMIFRSDMMAACFNYTFTGEPFRDLVESVPTTKFVLECLAACKGYWLGKPGITGNAHNSWSRHRPRWHLVLMADVLELAREARLPPDTAWRWLNVHEKLFYEAIGEARAKQIAVNLDTTEIARASWLFRTQISLPADVILRSQKEPPLFRR